MKGVHHRVYRAVIDTNVVISSLFAGKPREVMNLWRDGKLLLCLSPVILAEYLEVLSRFTSLPARDAQMFVEMFSDPDSVLVVGPVAQISNLRHQEVVGDPAHNMFLECAVAASVQAIISGDKHLLLMRHFREIPILSPGDFLASAGDM